MIGNGYWGCGRRKDAGACSNTRTIKTETYEQRVLAGLKSQMLQPDVVETYVREYHAHYKKVSGEIQASRRRLEAAVTKADRELQRLLDFIKRGVEFEELDQAVLRAKQDKQSASAELQDLQALPTVMLHPAVADDYRARVAQLETALAGDDQSRLEVIPQLRSLVERIVLRPAGEGKRGVEIEIEGRLAAMLALATDEPPPEEITIAVERVKGIEPSS